MRALGELGFRYRGFGRRDAQLVQPLPDDHRLLAQGEFRGFLAFAFAGNRHFDASPIGRDSSLRVDVQHDLPRSEAFRVQRCRQTPAHWPRVRKSRISSETPPKPPFAFMRAFPIACNPAQKLYVRRFLGFRAGDEESRRGPPHGAGSASDRHEVKGQRACRCTSMYSWRARI